MDRTPLPKITELMVIRSDIWKKATTFIFLTYLKVNLQSKKLGTIRLILIRSWL